VEENDEKVIDTESSAASGQQKCPKCGATDISLNFASGNLRCNYCRFEIEPEPMPREFECDISELSGEFIGSALEDIDENAENIATFKCESCGSEVVIETGSNLQARCHWCRNFLSINSQIPNGAVPDAILPFKITKEEARENIANFVKSRLFFANSHFKAEFTLENIMGVYLPYMVIDADAEVTLKGQGEVEIAHYVRKTRDGKNRIYFDADLYEVERKFNLAIDGLTVESSEDKITNTKAKTNNIINSILPFDTQSAVKWNANYLRGFTSEKRNLNVDNLRNFVKIQAQDIARFQANSSILAFNRGVKWENEEMKFNAIRWKSAYMPVWLYSYYEKKRNKSVIHYVAMNARTAETMGSIPLNVPKLLLFSFLIEILCALLVGVVWIKSRGDAQPAALFLLGGFLFYGFIYARYRNKGARHYHEKETEAKMSNLKKFDKFIKRFRGITNPSMPNANNTAVKGVGGKKI